MYIHRKQDENPVGRSSTNLHRQKNTLYLESLRYGIILQADPENNRGWMYEVFKKKEEVSETKFRTTFGG